MIKPGDAARARRQLNITVGEDVEPILVIKEDDRLICTSELDANGNQQFVHLKSQMENVWLSRHDVEPA
jgi:hypothetical protein